MAERQCPFHSANGGVALEEVAAIVRVGDRVKFQTALDQLLKGILGMEHDLDAAKGQALAFLAIALAAVLELGGDSSNHRFLLAASRELDQQTTVLEISNSASKLAAELCAPFLSRTSLNDDLIDSAIKLIDGHYEKPLEDEMVARKLGLSTSHFRHLFRQATGQPFQKYLLAVRLEKARDLLIRKTQTVGEVALSVGFTNSTTFSRAFSRRFAIAPSDLRQARVQLAK